MPRVQTYTETTDDIIVSVQPVFLETESDPEEGTFMWAYHVRIENHSLKALQLISRYWRITDAFGHTEEVQGGGVVGETPVIPPDEAFEYTSGARLKTPSGIMVGSYLMRDESGKDLEVMIPAFSLDSPHQPRVVN
jgi:ApaG protein